MRITQEHLDRFCCPVCFGALRLTPATVDCLACARRYPIHDGLPVLIASRALPSDDPLPA